MTAMQRKPRYPKEIETELNAALEKMLGRPIPPHVPPKEYIYLTKADCGYKIGRTTQPDKRPLTVAGNMPIKLTVVAVIEVPDSRKAEKEIHSHFEDKWLRGEWFDLNDQDVELVKGYPASFAALPPEPDVAF